MKSIITETHSGFIESMQVTVSTGDILKALDDTNDLSERVKETVNKYLEDYSGENFKSLSEFLEIGFSPETVEILKNCTEIIQLFL